MDTLPLRYKISYPNTNLRSFFLSTYVLPNYKLPTPSSEIAEVRSREDYRYGRRYPETSRKVVLYPYKGCAAKTGTVDETGYPTMSTLCSSLNFYKNTLTWARERRDDKGTLLIRSHGPDRATRVVLLLSIQPVSTRFLRRGPSRDGPCLVGSTGSPCIRLGRS